VAAIVFSALTWVGSGYIHASEMVRNVVYVTAFGLCGMLWRITRSDALKAVADAKKRLVLLGKVE
jgi:hypothetical protein